MDDGVAGSERPGSRWSDRVKVSTDSQGQPFAHRPHDVLATGGEKALELARKLAPGARIDGELGPFVRIGGVRDPIAVVRELQLHGLAAQPNHVLFAHCGCACPPHPSTACGGGASASPVYASPVYASPVYASPGGPPTRSSVRPAPPGADTAALAASFATPATPGSAHVVVLDTGMAGTFAPAALAAAPVNAGSGDTDAPDEDGNGAVDPAAGHGTFIAGVVEQVAPGSRVVVHRVLSTLGDGDEWSIALRIDGLALESPERTLLNLSFGGYVFEEALVLGWAIRAVQATGVVVVASAGNDATCRPTYPAALPDVVGVGAVGPAGPAPFTNYGPWVRACAPGVDLVSAFFEGFNGAEPAGAAGDPDDFAGWASWSGTSFAAPVVVGALARTMTMTGCSAREAAIRVIDHPSLMRIANLGTVVNVA